MIVQSKHKYEDSPRHLDSMESYTFSNFSFRCHCEIYVIAEVIDGKSI